MPPLIGSRYLTLSQSQMWLSCVRRVSQEQGISFEALAENAMLCVTENQSIPPCLTIAQLDRLLENMSHAAVGPLAKTWTRIDPLMHSPLGSLISVSSDFRSALQFTLQYADLLHPLISGKIIEQEGLSEIHYIPKDKPCSHHLWYDEILLGMSFCFAQMIGDCAGKVREIRMPEPLLAVYSGLYPASVKLSASAEGIVWLVDTALLDTKLPHYSPGLESSVQAAIGMMSRESQIHPRYCDIIVDILLEGLEEGPLLSLQNVSDILDMSPRTLQHYLSAERSSFNSLRSHILIRLSERYIAMGMLPREIAQKFGYSSRSAFHVAFKKLTGQTPSQFLPRLGM